MNENDWGKSLSLKHAIWATFYCLITVIVTSLLVAVILIVRGVPIEQAGNLHPKFTILVFFFGFMALIIYIKFKAKLGFNVLGFRRKNLSRSLLYGLIFGLMFGLMTIMFVRLDFSFSSISNNLRGMYLHPFTNINSWFAISTGPLYEETFYRAIWYRTLRNKIGIVPSIILVSLVWTLMHPRSHLFFYVRTFIEGIILALLYENTRNLSSSILAHSLGNLISAALL